jgi:hypothetical protein
MTSYYRYALAWLVCALALAGCNGSSSSSAIPSQTQLTKARYLDGAPELETLIGGLPQDLGVAYLQDDSQTVVSIFTYGSFSSFQPITPGVHTLYARNTEGYFVGPLKTPSLSAGKRYTLIVVGTYPKYQVLAFEEPPISDAAAISLYEASPSVPQAVFGRFDASSNGGYQQLGQGSFGTVTTVSLGAKATNVGGYVGPPSKLIGSCTPFQVNPADVNNVLPFQKASRLSLFLYDPIAGTSRFCLPQNTSGREGGPVFGSLDQ